MKHILLLFFSLITLTSIAQKQENGSWDKSWSPLMDSMGVEIIQNEKYLILIFEEKAVFDDKMKSEIDSWLLAMNTVSKVDRGVIVSKQSFKDHKAVYDKPNIEVARKNSLKDEWLLPK